MTVALMTLFLLGAGRPAAWGYDPGEWRAAASSGQERVQLTWDHDRATTWQTADAMQPGDWYELDLGARVKVGRVQTEPGEQRHGVPRSLLLELHDGHVWRDVVEAEQLIGDDGSLRLSFAPRQARRLRLTNRGTIPATPWVIAELYVWER